MARKKPVETAGPAALLARKGEYTVGQAAAEIGKNPDTVRRWIRQGKVTPRRVQCGQQTVSVFNRTEIRELAKFAKTVKMGRPPVGLAPMSNGKKGGKK